MVAFLDDLAREELLELAIERVEPAASGGVTVSHGSSLILQSEGE